MSFRKGLLAALVCAAIGGTAMAAPAGAAVLYDQTDSPSGAGIFSQQDPGTGSVSQLADDFTVPAGQNWTIQSVDVQGLYDVATTGPVNGVNVSLYSNAGTLPGPSVFSQQNITPSDGLAGPNFSIPLSGAPGLAAGTYWVSVQAIAPYPAKVWDWKTSTAVHGNPGVIAAAGIPGCPQWTVRGGACPTADGGPDQLFRLNGTAASTLPAPSGTPAQPRCRKHKRHKKAAAARKCKKKRKKKH